MATQTIHSMLAPTDCAVALIDYQPAMFAGVHSHDRTTIVQNVQILAKAAKLFRVPTLLSTVAATSFSGAMIPEITGIFPDQKPIDRTSINSWLDPNFKGAIEQIGRRKIVVAGLWTEACVMFPTLDLLQAGAVPMNTLQVLFELQQDWARSETYEGCMEILKAHSPYGIEVRFVKEFLGGHGG